MNDGIELLDGSVRSVRSVGLCVGWKKLKDKKKGCVAHRIPPDSPKINPPIVGRN
jgi:hypothetical protein